MVISHFDTPEYKQFFSVKLTPARQAVLDLHYPHYIKSRRDCWGAAAVKAPLDVKRAIWEHEKDELIYDPRMGSTHLTDEQMATAIMNRIYYRARERRSMRGCIWRRRGRGSKV